MTRIVMYGDIFVSITVRLASVPVERWWQVHGPDLSGGYGELQGMGGLEALINEATGEAVGMIDDAYGHILEKDARQTVIDNESPPC